MEFTLLQEARILYGAGKVQETGALLRRLGVDKALVVCDEGVKKAGIVERVTNSLTQAQVEFALFDKVQADPPSEVVDEGAAFCRAERCGAVIAVGGGSSIDTAKGINLLRCNPGKIMDYAGQKNEMKKAGGLVAVPTTAGTGSELSDGLVITSPEHVKCPILATNAMAEYIVLDPLLTVGLPAGLTASTGMDVLAHSVESYTSTAASVPTDQISEGNIRSVIQWLPLAVSYPDAVKPRPAYGRGQYAGRLDAPVRAYARRALRSAYTGRAVRHSARICMCLCASMGSGIQCPGSPGKNGRGGADVRMFIYRRRNTTAGRHGRPPGCHSLQR